MSITAQKYLVGFLGLALLASVLLAGHQDSKNRKRENPQAAAAKPPLGPQLQAGQKVYKEFGCFACHGEDGGHGLRNYNAQSGQQVPPINHVVDSYTREELIAKIRKGVPVEPKLDPNGPTPPLYMPSFGTAISDPQMQDLIIFLYSLKPKGEELNF
jgi:mono/diheme cytochrome c family protein